jgi:ribosomal protein S25
MVAKGEKTQARPSGGASRGKKEGRSQGGEPGPRMAAREERAALSAEELITELSRIRAITPHAVASRLNIKMGEAKRLLRDLERQGRIRCVGGNSRIRIYCPAS